jgi:hypothetical protein
MLLLQDERDQLRARLEDALMAGGVGQEAALGRGAGAGLNPQVYTRQCEMPVLLGRNQGSRCFLPLLSAPLQGAIWTILTLSLMLFF